MVRAALSPLGQSMVRLVPITRKELTNDPVLLGPDSVGQFMPTAVKTIQRKRASVNSGEAGQSVSYVYRGVLQQLILGLL